MESSPRETSKWSYQNEQLAQEVGYIVIRTDGANKTVFEELSTRVRGCANIYHQYAQPRTLEELHRCVRGALSSADLNNVGNPGTRKSSEDRRILREVDEEIEVRLQEAASQLKDGRALLRELPLNELLEQEELAYRNMLAAYEREESLNGSEPSVEIARAFASARTNADKAYARWRHLDGVLSLVRPNRR